MRVVLVTIGSLGDLHPFIAIGRALETLGVAVTLAAPRDQIAAIEKAGLRGAAVLPAAADICQRLGIDEKEMARRVLSERDFVLEQVLLPSLGTCVSALDPVVAEADLVVASSFALAAGITAEAHRLPLVDVILQPMSMLSACDPPRGRGFSLMIHAGFRMAYAWNQACYAAIRFHLRHRYRAQIDTVRQAHGLPAAGRGPIIDPSPARRQMLACYSPAFAPLPADAPPNCRATGFPLFDGGTMLDVRLARFLEDSEPPIVFTLGSFAWEAGTRFYDEAKKAVGLLGRRAILLTGGTAGFAREGDIATIGYAPHSLLFPNCAAVVHHGGIGTTAQALKAGRPQMIVPHCGDQHDNAARCAALGLGPALPAKLFTARRAALLLAKLLEDEAVHRNAATMARRIENEDGAVEAARLIAAFGASLN